jgi:glutathione S-transferase
VDDGQVFAETGLIVEYLVTKYGPQLAPSPSSDLHWRYIYWLHYAEGSLMPPLLLKLVLDKMSILGWPAQGFVKAQLNLHLDYLEGELGKTPWFAGEDFTAADVMMSFPLEAAAARAGLDKSRPLLWAFLEKIHARPAYRRALEKGGAYAFAK